VEGRRQGRNRAGRGRAVEREGKNRAAWEKVEFFVGFFGRLCSCPWRGAPPEGRTPTVSLSKTTAGGVSPSDKRFPGEAIRANPDDPKPKFNMAVIFQDQGRVEEAEAIYRAILDRNPGYAPAWSNLASVQEKRGQADAAEKSYRRALEVDRDNPWAASQFGYFYFRAGKLDEARALFEESLRRNPRCSNAWFGLAEIAEKRGDAAAAIKDYDKAILFNPSDLPAYLRAADLRIARGEREAAIGLLRRASRSIRAGRYPFFAWSPLREAGKWKEAEKAFDEAKDTGVLRRNATAN